MKNKLISRWAPVGLVAVALVVVAARQQAAPTVAFVNVETLLDATPGFAEARSTYESELARFEQELEQFGDSIQTLITAFQQQQVALTPTERSARQNELVGLQQQYGQREQDLRVRIQERRVELLTPIQERAQTVIDGFRTERNLTVIFDVTAQGSGIVAADPALDVTPQVVERLRADSGPSRP